MYFLNTICFYFNDNHKHKCIISTSRLCFSFIILREQVFSKNKYWDPLNRALWWKAEHFTLTSFVWKVNPQEAEGLETAGPETLVFFSWRVTYSVKNKLKLFLRWLWCKSCVPVLKLIMLSKTIQLLIQIKLSY